MDSGEEKVGRIIWELSDYYYVSVTDVKKGLLQK